MPRFAAGLEYDGRAYSGWQGQPGLNTVQDVVQRAIARVADAPVECTCAGRTDAGVHAAGQVASVRLSSSIPPDELQRALNSRLPPSKAWMLVALDAI